MFRHSRRSIQARIGAVLGLWLLVSVPRLATAETDPVLLWNENAAKTATAACLHLSENGLFEARMYAMVHAAIHDAVNAIDRRSRPYVFGPRGSSAASVDAAVATAAHDVLVAVLPAMPDTPTCVASGIAEADALHTAALAAIPASPAKVAGIALGQSAAAAILAQRAGDGSDNAWVDPFYPQGTEPGEWRFTPDTFQIAFAPTWGEVTPFVLRRGSQFRPRKPLRVSGPRYAADYNEVKSLGGDGVNTESARTPDQTEIGLFWVESSPRAWNRLARALAAAQGLDAWENARLFGLLNLAMADGYIASLNAKYHYKFWRPITAIRLGDDDGNPRTAADPGWTPLHFTYPIPDHPSAHAVEGGAAAEILRQVFGTDAMSFAACSMTVAPGRTCDDPSPILRSYTTFSQAAEENAVSRIYIGIHFRHAVKTGVRQGRQIADHAVRHFMRPVSRRESHHADGSASGKD